MVCSRCVGRPATTKRCQVGPWLAHGSLRYSDISILGEESTFGVCRAIFYLGRPGGTRSDSFQINNHLNQNLRGCIAQPCALEVVSTFQPLKINSERALTPATHWQSRLAATVRRKSDFTLKMLRMHHMIPIPNPCILVVISIAGCSLQITEATAPPNLALVPIVVCLLIKQFQGWGPTSMCTLGHPKWAKSSPRPGEPHPKSSPPKDICVDYILSAFCFTTATLRVRMILGHKFMQIIASGWCRR